VAGVEEMEESMSEDKRGSLLPLPPFFLDVPNSSFAKSNSYTKRRMK
jgi:hypothetical protein